MVNIENHENRFADIERREGGRRRERKKTPWASWRAQEWCFGILVPVFNEDERPLVPSCFQFVSSCFPVSRSVGAGIGQTGVCFSGIAGPWLSDSGVGGRVERMEGTNDETRGWLMLG
ncbi:MAG: hypothetical protein IKQ15_00130 [Kiritimatiellae bacterium]|nr:hypothetical protein [Kiritimatiellia bacterium]